MARHPIEFNVKRRHLRCTESFMDKFIDYYKKQHPKTGCRCFVVDELHSLHPIPDTPMRSHLEYHYLHTGQMMLALTPEQRRYYAKWYIDWDAVKSALTGRPHMINLFDKISQ